MTDLQRWTTTAKRRVFENRWLAVELEQVQLPGGGRYEYTLLVPAAKGVAVIGFNDAGEILLEREYRHGVGEVIWQLPGGLCDGDEDLQQAGLRELKEETGYEPHPSAAEGVRYLGAVWDNPALGPGESHLFAAWGLEKTAEPRRDPQEFVTLHWVTKNWLREAVRSGKIRDRVVVAAVLYLVLEGWI